MYLKDMDRMDGDYTKAKKAHGAGCAACQEIRNALVPIKAYADKMWDRVRKSSAVHKKVLGSLDEVWV